MFPVQLLLAAIYSCAPAANLTTRQVSCAYNQAAFNAWVPSLVYPLTSLTAPFALLGACTSPAYYTTLWPTIDTHWTNFQNLYLPNQACFGIYYQTIPQYMDAATSLLSNYNKCAAAVQTFQNLQCNGWAVGQAEAMQNHLVQLQAAMNAIGTYAA